MWFNSWSDKSGGRAGGEVFYCFTVLELSGLSHRLCLSLEPNLHLSINVERQVGFLGTSGGWREVFPITTQLQG